jgi:hypothetical protein
MQSGASRTAVTVVVEAVLTGKDARPAEIGGIGRALPGVPHGAGLKPVGDDVQHVRVPIGCS